MIRNTIDHVGIVVPNLEPAMEQLGEQLGYEIRIVFDQELPVVLRHGGSRDVHLRIAVTTQIPRLELIEAAPGTPWSADSIGLHHLAFYAEDLRADSETLETTCPIEVRGRDEHGDLTLFTYHTGVGGVFRAELLQTRSS
jgi:Glyoxalase/Bleomycin resistance protein/Dioxygenase superfamily